MNVKEWDQKKDRKKWYFCAYIERPLLKYDVYLRSIYCQKQCEESYATLLKKGKRIIQDVKNKSPEMRVEEFNLVQHDL